MTLAALINAIAISLSLNGRVCDVGFWALSRHPNYFFEWLGWLAHAVITIDPTTPTHGAG